MSTSAPKYNRIFQILRAEILEGKYAECIKFPSEGMLVRRFGASRPTVERALRELKREGLLESRAGSGSYLTFTAKNATGAIGIIAPDYHSIEFFTRLCDAIATEARAAGYDVLLGDVSVPHASDRGNWAVAIAKAYTERKIAGVLLEPLDLIPDSCKVTDKVLAILAKKKIPVVLLDRDYLPFPERSHYDLVGIDNLAAGYKIAKHMIANGAREIRFLTHANYANTIRGRIQGVAQAAIDAGLNWRSEYVLETDPSDISFFSRLMRKKNAPDAFVCRNDPTAAKLLQTLATLKRPVPRSVQIAGFDDSEIANLTTPALTTAHQPVNTLAGIAVASLLQRIRAPELSPRTILLDAGLVVRKSTHATRS